jgi:AcrR family transcriptional regulator
LKGVDVGDSKAAKKAKPKIAKPRLPVTRDRALAAALTLADEHGLPAVTMRKIAESLGVEAMSLYHHVANKDDVLDGMVDLVFAKLSLPSKDREWKEAMRDRADSVRLTLMHHRWAIGVMESRASPGPSILRHHDAVIGCLRNGGFSITGAAHAFALLDSYVFGFVLQEANLPFVDAGTPGTDHGNVGELIESMTPHFSPDEFPHLVEMVTEHVTKPGYRFGDEFAFGLELVLDGLERYRSRPV